MGLKRIIHGVDINDFASHIKSAAELLKNLVPDDDDEVIKYAETLLFRQALLGDTVAHNALYLLDPERSDSVQKAMEVYDTALNTFEKTDPNLAGSILSEVTQENVRRLFFALLGVEQEDSAFKFLEGIWQYISWSSPRNKIPEYAFNTVFATLMAMEKRKDAYSLLKDAEEYIEWNNSTGQRTTVEAAMEIFSVFLSLGKYALAKRTIEVMKPIVDYQDFLAQLEADIEEDSRGEVVLQQDSFGEETSTDTVEEFQDTTQEIQGISDLSNVIQIPPIPPEEKQVPKFAEKKNKNVSSLQDIASLVAQTAVEANNPIALAMVKAYGVPVPQPILQETVSLSREITSSPSGNPDFPHDLNIPLWDSKDSPMGIIEDLNDNLLDILMTLVKADGVKCVKDIPITVEGFRQKFPRFSDDKYEKKIVPIVIKVKRILESAQACHHPSIAKKQANFFLPNLRETKNRAYR